MLKRTRVLFATQLICQSSLLLYRNSQARLSDRYNIGADVALDVIAGKGRGRVEQAEGRLPPSMRWVGATMVEGALRAVPPYPFDCYFDLFSAYKLFKRLGRGDANGLVEVALDSVGWVSEAQPAFSRVDANGGMRPSDFSTLRGGNAIQQPVDDARRSVGGAAQAVVDA